MTSLKNFNAFNKPSLTEKSDIIDFLFVHLEQFRDSKEDIEKAIDFAIKETPSFGGFILTKTIDNIIVCTVVVNRTGMKGYIPENILVYIATHKDYRGKGIGKELMLKAIEIAKGNVALHVEHDNPARFLYEKIGFTNKYLEMRLNKKI